MVAPWITFVKIAVEDEGLVNFIDIPLFNVIGNSTQESLWSPHRLLKILDDDIVTFLRGGKLIPLSGNASLETRRDAVDYTFPNKTVKFFVILQMSTGGGAAFKVRTSDTVNTADGIVREDVTATLAANDLYTTEVIEGNFNGKFLTIENNTAQGFFASAAVIIEPA